MNIVVLLKAVPVVGTERLGGDLLTDRSVQLEANGNDEYLLEKALKLTETHGGEVTPADRRTGRRDRARCARRWPWAPRGPFTLSTTRSAVRTCARRVDILAAALGKMEFDLVFAGADTSDGQGGVRWSGARRAPRPAVPVLRVGDRAAARRWGAHPAHQRRRLRRPRGADAGRGDGHAAPRGAALPVAARDHAGALEADRHLDAGRPRPRRRQRSARVPPRRGRSVADKPAERAGATFVREPADVAVAQIVDFLASRRLI